jgi:hypothetical protein
MENTPFLVNLLTLWFHKVDDNNWTADSYKKVCECKNWDDITYTLHNIKQYTSGMFFFMKNNIKPLYEDDNNKKGGYWSCKINKNNSSELWCKLVYYMCSGDWNDNGIIYKNNDNINGISISPKINNCIIKIWIKNFDKKLEHDLDHFFTKYELGEILYKPHVL